MQFAWKDNALVLFLSTTTSDPNIMVIQNRKRPSLTSSSAKTARKPFGSEPRKDLPIPKFVDDYNHLMNQVDIADQLRSTNAGNRRIRRGGWHALWNFLFHVTIVNSYLLSDYKSASKFRVDLQAGLLARSSRLARKRKVHVTARTKCWVNRFVDCTIEDTKLRREKGKEGGE